jgi:hypothetical protein
MLWSTYETTKCEQMRKAKNIYDTFKCFKWACVTQLKLANFQLFIYWIIKTQVILEKVLCDLLSPKLSEEVSL